MYIHYGETQQPYKREIKTCPNLMLYKLLHLLSLTLLKFCPVFVAQENIQPSAFDVY